ncbi:MAG: hypothetical protein DMG47_14790, partial [Acidobacteria bacterium]
IRWPSGLTQAFEHLPVNHRIEIEEGSDKFMAKPFGASPPSYRRAGEPQKRELLPSLAETWLIEPLSAPEFSLPDVTGKTQELRSFRGGTVLLHFWAAALPPCREQLRLLQKYKSVLADGGLRILGINVDDLGDAQAARTFAAKEALSFPNVFATREVAGIYNIIYRYLFDRRRDQGRHDCQGLSGAGASRTADGGFEIAPAYASRAHSEGASFQWSALSGCVSA